MQSQPGVEVDEGLGGLVVVLEALLERVRVVVGAADQGLAGHVVHSGDLYKNGHKTSTI